MSTYSDRLKADKKTELSQRITSSIAEDIWAMSLYIETEQEFVDYLMTITDQDAIEEFFNKCHASDGRFCGGGTSERGGKGPNRGPGSRIPAPIDYVKTTVKSAWKVRQQRQKSSALKEVTGPLFGITGPYGVRLNRLGKADHSKFSDKDLGILKDRLESNQRKYNAVHTKALLNTGASGAAIGIAALSPTLVAAVNPAAAAGVAAAYGVARWKTKRIPWSILRIENEMKSRNKGFKHSIKLDSGDTITFQTKESDLPTLEQEIAMVMKEIQGINPEKLSRPSKAELDAVLDLMAEALEDDDASESVKKAIRSALQ